MADKSPEMEMRLTSLDLKKISSDIVYFSLVPISFYVIQILYDISLPGHILILKDFIPSNATLIATVSWVGNQILNAIRKYRTLKEVKK